MNTQTPTQSPDKFLTAEGLTFKGVSKIERLNCDAKRQDLALLTWQCSRLVRRDFNLMTYKMFMMARNRAVRAKLIRALVDLREEANVIEVMAMPFELKIGTAPAMTANLRIVSDEAQTLIDTIRTVDKALAKLSGSEMAEVAFDNCGRYFAAYERLKRVVISKKPDGPADCQKTVVSDVNNASAPQPIPNHAPHISESDGQPSMYLIAASEGPLGSEPEILTPHLVARPQKSLPHVWLVLAWIVAFVLAIMFFN